MKKILLGSFLALFICPLFSQNVIKGIVVDGDSQKPLQNVAVHLVHTERKDITNQNGEFQFQNLSSNTYVLAISFNGYDTQQLPVQITETILDLGIISLQKSFSQQIETGIISLTEEELNDDDDYSDNLVGILLDTKDVFLQAAAYDFSATFFRPRGFDSSYGKVLINGIEMNKFHSGRPQWANWGGLNDFQRHQEFSPGSMVHEASFGGIAGTTNIIMRPSDYEHGGKISYVNANRSYQGRVMVSYSSGSTTKGWSYLLLASRRYGNSGYVNGTPYDANSFFGAVEKQLNDSHSLSLNLIYTQNKRGRSTALTDEIFTLKGRQYNPLWGYLDGKAKNSRIREIEEPIITLHHYWDLSKKTSLQTNIAFQTGFTGNTRIDSNGSNLVTLNNGDVYIEGGARNPLPNYYQNLPSYHLRQASPSSFQYHQAYLAQQEFIQNGQLNWKQLFDANILAASNNKNAVYAIQEDRVDDTQFSFNSVLNSELTNHIRINASVSYKSLTSNSYAQIKDLIGGTGFLDIDVYAEENSDDSQTNFLSTAQSNLQSPNRIVTEGEKYKYNYIVNAQNIHLFGQAQFSYPKTDFYTGIHLSTRSYQRNGLYENGYFPGNSSFGKGEKLAFTNYSIKSGATYKISGKHLVNLNAVYMNKAPNIHNSYENIRQNNHTVYQLQSENILSADVSYLMRSPMIDAKITGYFAQLGNGSDVNFFFTENGSVFTQEVVTNIGRRHIGIEFGAKVQLTPSFAFKGAAAVGQFAYSNNPTVYYTSSDFSPNPDQNNTVRRTFEDGTSQLKGLRISNGPQNAFQLGFEYRDSDYWWMGATANYFSNAFISPSILKRTGAFATDFSLIPDQVLQQEEIIKGYAYSNYDENNARRLLQQEEIPPYLLVNLVGGKSWRIDKYYVGTFFSVNNILNQQYKTGGFEQSRKVSYQDQIEEQSLPNGPLFGNRYFFGNGTTYYLNFYIKF